MSFHSALRLPPYDPAAKARYDRARTALDDWCAEHEYPIHPGTPLARENDDLQAAVIRAERDYCPEHHTRAGQLTGGCRNASHNH